MSSSTQIIHTSNFQLHSSGIKTQVHNILQKNHVILWQHFIISVLNHIEYNNHKDKYKGQKLQLWIKREIQKILIWISDPKNRQHSNKYLMRQKYWVKQKQQWENTFELLLQNQFKIRDQYDLQLQQLQHKVQKLQHLTTSLKAKNSILEKTAKLYKIKYQKEHNIKRKVIEILPPSSSTLEERINRIQQENQSTSSNLKIFSELDIKIQPFNCMYKKLTQDYSIMAIPLIQSLQQLQNRISFNKIQQFIDIKPQKQTQTQSKLTILKQFVKSQSLIIHIQKDNIKKQKIIIQTQSKQRRLSINNSIIQFKINLNQKKQLNQSISSSQSSFFLQCDTGTQTDLKIYKTIDTQTYTNQKDNILTTFLLKIAQLQQQVQEKNLQITINNTKIKQMQQKLMTNKREISELNQEIKVSHQLQQHINEKYQNLNKQLIQVQENYKQLLCNLTSYIDRQTPKSFQTIFIQQGVQTDLQTQIGYSFGKDSNLTTTFGMSQISKSDQFDDQILTIQSQQQEFHQNLVQKSTIQRYLLQFMTLQIESGPADKKLNVFVTLLQTLGITKHNGPLVKQYANKISYHSQLTRDYKQKQPIQQKLYKYLTYEQ